MYIIYVYIYIDKVEKNMGVYRGYLWLARSEGIEKKWETTIMDLRFRV